MPAVVLRSEPGIKRDGTNYEGEFYRDGQWVRFQRGLPRKMGGYRAVNRYVEEISRGFTSFSQNMLQYCHTGGANRLDRFTIDNTLSASSLVNRTPAGLVASVNNTWTFATIFDPSGTPVNRLIAHVAPNGASPTNDAGGQIFQGELTAITALTAVALPAGANATGGVVSLHPYLFYYGSGGIIGWSVPGSSLASPINLTGSGSGVARVWGQKIIKGLPLRAGSGSAPAGIFWAYDAVIRSSFVGGAAVFQFDTIATDTSIMSADSVVDYDGVFYWAGVDRFLQFNGVVREVPNALNLNWFFDNLNVAQRSRVFAFKVPRYGEIWWCYPRGAATECTHAVIYNVRENTWYDTALPAEGRCAGGFNNEFAAPLLLDWTSHLVTIDVMGVPTEVPRYSVWLHERGVNHQDENTELAIQSFFETSDLSTLVQGQDAAMRIERIEPDFVQSGPMFLQVSGRENARAPNVVSSQFIFPATATLPHDQIVMMKEQRRELRVRFESNALGGNYQMGQIIAHVGPGDGRSIS